MGSPHSDIFIYFSDPNRKILPVSFILKMHLSDLGARYGFAWDGLVSCCNSISTYLVSPVTNISSKRNSYLLNRLWNIVCYSSVKYFISDTTLRRSDFFQ